MNISIRWRLLLAPATLAVLLASTACNSDDDSGETITWAADITSAESVLYAVNSAGSTVYGWNRLIGTTEIQGESVDIEMLGNVDYVEGSGPFFGFITLTFPGGDTIAMRMTGEASAASDTSGAQFTAELGIIGGTGRYVDSDGEGSWSGGRQETLGNAVSIEGELKIRQSSD